MADGPVANLPSGMNAYAGYVNRSGIGITFPQVEQLAAKEKAIAFSITTDGAPAQCADCEAGAMSDWRGYAWGYCQVSNVNAQIARYGRPQKLWTAHYDQRIGPHICSPACWPGLVTTADGTQWTNHGKADWDESLLRSDFFALSPSPPQLSEVEIMAITELANGDVAISAVGAGSSPGHQLLFVVNPNPSAGQRPIVIDVTDGIGPVAPGSSLYTVAP